MDRTDFFDFSALTRGELHLTNLFAMRQTWQPESVFRMTKPRPTDAFLLLSDTVGDYVQGARTFRAACGSLVFLPHGSTYTTVFGRGMTGKQTSLLVEFTALDGAFCPISFSEHVTILDDRHTRLYETLFSDIIAHFGEPVCPMLMVKAGVYALLESIAASVYETSLKHYNYAAIAPGIRYLENDAAQTRSIAEIAAMCHVSTAYFEKLFRSYTGMTPTAFRVARKIERAKRLLERTELPMEQIAAELGFFDGAHFCRLFKSHTGMAPKHYRDKARTLPGEDRRA